jgi:hypothetical protein
VGTKQNHGAQPGDPVRAGAAMIAIARNAEAPRHLVLGAWGFDAVVDYTKKLTMDIESLRELSLSADFPKV